MPNWLAVVTLNPPIDSMYPPASRDLHFTANKCSKSFVTTLIYSVEINLSNTIFQKIDSITSYRVYGLFN